MKNQRQWCFQPSPHSLGTLLTTSTLFKVDSNTEEGPENMPFAIRRKIRREGSFITALFSSVQPKHPHPTAEKDSWSEKNPGGGERRQGKLLNSVSEKTLMACQRKESCAALNHKSFSRLCQISSTLQALKRKKETLLFGSLFSEDDRKLKGARINPKVGTKCGVAPGCRAAAEPLRLALLPPPAASAKPATAPRRSPRARPPATRR